jgi:hypothetical protein
VKRELIRPERDGEASGIDRYLCSLFNENDAARLRKRVEAWFKLPYFADRKAIILDSLDAHKAGKWTLTIPTLLPLVDGVMSRFRREHLRPSKNAHRGMQVDKFIDYYRRNQPKLFQFVEGVWSLDTISQFIQVMEFRRKTSAGKRTRKSARAARSSSASSQSSPATAH